MINRLEELLDQVEDTEEDGEILSLRQIRAVSGTAAAESGAAEESENGRRGQNGQLSFRGVVRAESTGEGGIDRVGESPFFRKLTYTGYSSGLDVLYRKVSRILGSESVDRSGSVAVVRETVSAPAAGLTAGELDLAMRRDSRRYDGGMTIY